MLLLLLLLAVAVFVLIVYYPVSQPPHSHLGVGASLTCVYRIICLTIRIKTFQPLYEHVRMCIYRD